MAYLQYANGTKHTVKPDIAAKVWEVLEGEREGTEEEQEFCSGIARVVFHWRDAPDSYIRKHFDIIVQMHFGDWMCDYQGHLTKPDPARPLALEFAKKWGLYEHGQPTKKALDLIVIYQQPRWR